MASADAACEASSLAADATWQIGDYARKRPNCRIRLVGWSHSNQACQNFAQWQHEPENLTFLALLSCEPLKIRAMDALHYSCVTLASGLGRDARRFFEANSTAIGEKNNAADRPSPLDHRPQRVMQSVPSYRTCSRPNFALYLLHPARAVRKLLGFHQF